MRYDIISTAQFLITLTYKNRHRYWPIRNRERGTCMSLCGYRKLQADRARSRWFIGLTYRVTQWADEGVRQSGNVAGRVLCTAAKYAVLLFAAIVNTFWLLGAQVMWLMCRMTARDRPKPECGWQGAVYGGEICSAAFRCHCQYVLAAWRAGDVADVQDDGP